LGFAQPMHLAQAVMPQQMQVMASSTKALAAEPGTAAHSSQAVRSQKLQEAMSSGRQGDAASSSSTAPSPSISASAGAAADEDAAAPPRSTSSSAMMNSSSASAPSSPSLMSLSARSTRRS
jgi:hypothetical protein